MRLDTKGLEWIRKSTLVKSRLVNWGYPVDLLTVDGLTAEGYQELVLDENGKRQIDWTNNRLLVKFVPWNFASHWEWLLANAPLELEPSEVPVEEEEL